MFYNLLNKFIWLKIYGKKEYNLKFFKSLDGIIFQVKEMTIATGRHTLI